MADDEEIPTLIENDTVEGKTEPKELPLTVPLTIICGFLGAGKSTLVKRILTERHGYRIAVIMNEFGDTAQSEEFLELANGCLCCSIKDTGVAAIERLMQKKGAFDHILLETTGLADPGPIASMFWQNEEFAMGLGRDIHLDGVVCVVDAVFGRQQMEEDHSDEGIGESLRQIAGSDVILSTNQVESTEDVIRSINPAASIYRTVRGQIDLKRIMGIERPTHALHSSHDGHDHDHDHSNHDHPHPPTHYELRGISSLQVNCPVLSPSQYEKLDEWIALPGESSGHGTSDLIVLRCKGMFRTTASETYVLQGVRNLYDIMKVEEGGEADTGVPDMGKVVLIGKGLDERVRQSLKAVLSS
ncbi:CobW domain-containing protein [Fomitopsis serialis]|uniref:CobW domain-containing protein n=1 Tax=Fomitopsis serialis TaxID=139415 RepID=UPI002008CA2A|nr:CobW domain-containing protein [Neoantrodia serialis]KAH9936251.1 CobW domain-containing protein [Neoantrodia serialis]